MTSMVRLMAAAIKMAGIPIGMSLFAFPGHILPFTAKQFRKPMQF
jgi:hypothetical protein